MNVLQIGIRRMNVLYVSGARLNVFLGGGENVFYKKKDIKKMFFAK